MLYGVKTRPFAVVVSCLAGSLLVIADYIKAVTPTEKT
jgi:hypothetical protein